MATSAPNNNLPPIAALSSGGGLSAIALIRLTGIGSHELLHKLISPKFKSDQQFTARKLILCSFNDFDSGESIDEPLVSFFYDSNSFTGEPAAEIHCHGGQYIISQILRSLYQVGFQEARPGEFSHRAFLNHKLDLTQAEGINDLIHAQSHSQWQAARQLASGQLAACIEALREQVIGTLALLEARIDFPEEEETSAVAKQAVLERAQGIQKSIQTLMDSYSGGQVAAQGLAVCLIGEPNAGKSTLMNTLLSKDRAIVTEIAGTTRDYLEEACLINGRLIRLIDTAGIRATDNKVERLGVDKAKELAESSDLILFLYAADAPEQTTKNLQNLATQLADKPSINILTKADLGEPKWAEDYLHLSCQDHAGIDELKHQLSSCVDQHISQLDEQVFISNQRHYRSLEAALQGLTKFFEAAESDSYDECLAFELQQVQFELTSIVGHIGSDDIFDKIFSQFCIGK